MKQFIYEPPTPATEFYIQHNLHCMHPIVTFYDEKGTPHFLSFMIDRCSEKEKSGLNCCKITLASNIEIVGEECEVIEYPPDPNLVKKIVLVAPE